MAGRKAGMQIWNVVEAYPLFAAIGGGCTLCACHLARFMIASPDVNVSKANRANPMSENFEEGKRWKGLGVRGFANSSSYSAKKLWLELSKAKCAPCTADALLVLR